MGPCIQPDQKLNTIHRQNQSNWTFETQKKTANVLEGGNSLSENKIK
jgi:hypothetical protein